MVVTLLGNSGVSSIRSSRFRHQYSPYSLLLLYSYFSLFFLLHLLLNLHLLHLHLLLHQKRTPSHQKLIALSRLVQTTPPTVAATAAFRIAALRRIHKLLLFQILLLMNCQRLMPLHSLKLRRRRLRR